MTKRCVTINIDDMRVGDFLHLLDCMQEECCEHKRCSECRYNDFCDVDMPSIDSVSLRKTIEEYAEMNRLFDHMHYVNQKWIPVEERLPGRFEKVLVTCKYINGNKKVYMTNIDECMRWKRTDIDGEVIAWMPLPEPYRGEEV